MSLKMMTIDKLRFISEASQYDKSSLVVVVANGKKVLVK